MTLYISSICSNCKHAKKRNKTGNENGLNLSYSQKKHNDSVGWKGNHLHTSKKQKTKATVSQKLERKRYRKLYTLICTLYSMQLCKMAGHELVPLWHPVLNTPPLDGIYICVKSNAHTKPGTTTFKTGAVLFNMGVETDTSL